ncbi:MAG: putative DNA-binding domain-containing protein [Betaproteobacteria bacterium]|nr:putative DNA-binding domain-containing protein [Betaproteobacteria bacterium]
MTTATPSLRDMQQAMRRSLLGHDDSIAAFVVDDGVAATERLGIYRNTFVGVATRALRLNHPAVARLVGDDFFDATAQAYIVRHPPTSAWLDQYGDAYADFLAQWQAVASLPYLADVARLEWAVGRALHAPDAAAVDAATLASLAALAPEAPANVRFDAHPALQLVRTATPADAIWRAVLDRDDAALTSIDLAAGQRWLLVERSNEGVDVVPMHEAGWNFTLALCAGETLQQALDAVAEAPDFDATTLLAQHFAAGRFTGFRTVAPLPIA